MEGYSFYRNALWKHKILLRSSNCSCDMQPNVTVILQWLPVCNVPLVPSCLLAVVIGLCGSYKLHQLGTAVTGSLSYAITFALYALMITSGLVLHCLLLVECGQAPVTQDYIVMSNLDGSLSTSIAISFLYNGLIDLKVLPERAFGTVISMVFVYAWVFYAYFMQLLSPLVLYLGAIIICCSLYLVTQLLYLVTNQCRALPYLILAGLSGGGSLWVYYKYKCWLCQTLGAWSLEGVWYYGSDVAMFFVFLYVWTTRRYISDPPGSKSSQVKGDIPNERKV